MPRGIPAKGHRQPGGGRKASSPEPKKNLTLYVTNTERAQLTTYLKTLRGETTMNRNEFDEQSERDHETADRIIEDEGETTETSSYFRMRAEWNEYLSQNEREHNGEE